MRLFIALYSDGPPVPFDFAVHHYLEPDEEFKEITKMEKFLVILLPVLDN